MKKSEYVRVNYNIRASMVRVVQDGNPLGVMSIDRARKLAQDAGLDLVEVAPQANPPVCAIIGYDKYRYQQKQLEKEQRRKQKHTEVKELRLRPGTQDHDLETKANAVRRFIQDGKKVQLNLQYKNRELAHKDEGFRVMNKIIGHVSDVATVERPPRMEGSRLTCFLTPKC